MTQDLSLAEMLLIQRKRELILTFHRKYYLHTGCMNLDDFRKLELGMRMNNYMTELEYKKIIDTCYEKGVCLNCGENLKVKVYGMGYDDNPYEEQEIVCDSCGWKE